MGKIANDTIMNTYMFAVSIRHFNLVFLDLLALYNLVY